MSGVRIIPGASLGFNFVPRVNDAERPWPFGTAAEDWRPLTAEEITLMESYGNRADSWLNILVNDGFHAGFVRDCRFYGPTRIGALEDAILQQNDLKLPIGLYSSTIIACDIASNIAIHNVAYLAHTRIEERCILFNVDEIVTTNHAKFGNGIVMDGESEDIRIWVEIGNENGGRKVLPFNGMIPADAWIWSKYRDDRELMARFFEMTDNAIDSRLGAYSVIGAGTKARRGTDA